MKARPASLNDVGVRIAEMVRHSDQDARGWDREAGFAMGTVGKIAAKGDRALPNARTLLVLDDLTGAHLLTPPEREWACERQRRTQEGRP